MISDEIIEAACEKAQDWIDFNRDQAIQWEMTENPNRHWGSEGVDVFYEKYGSDPKYVDPEDNAVTIEGDDLYQKMIDQYAEKEKEEFIADYPHPKMETLEDLELADHDVQFIAFKTILKELGVSYDDHWADSGSAYITVYGKSNDEVKIRFADHDSSPFNERSTFDISPTQHEFNQVLQALGRRGFI